MNELKTTPICKICGCKTYTLRSSYPNKIYEGDMCPDCMKQEIRRDKQLNRMRSIIIDGGVPDSLFIDAVAMFDDCEND